MQGIADDEAHGLVARQRHDLLRGRGRLAGEREALFGPFAQAAGHDAEAARHAEARVFAAIDRLDLRRHVWELETRGWTVIEPERVGPPDLAVRVRDKVLEVAERRHQDLRVDLDTGLSKPDLVMQFGEGVSMSGILFEDPIFESAVMNEAALALVTYLLGESCQLSSLGGIIKTQGRQHMELHVDAVGMPPPLPSYPLVANATWALTDYSGPNGSTCFVDGSHHLCRPPTAAEAVDIDLFKPVEAPAGSIIVWGGNVWHGAVPRTAPGLRVGLLAFYSRWFMYKGEADPALRVTREMLDRNPPRFGRISGVTPVALFPDEDESPTTGRAALSRFA